MDGFQHLKLHIFISIYLKGLINEETNPRVRLVVGSTLAAAATVIILFCKKTVENFPKKKSLFFKKQKFCAGK